MTPNMPQQPSFSEARPGSENAFSLIRVHSYSIHLIDLLCGEKEKIWPLR